MRYSFNIYSHMDVRQWKDLRESGALIDSINYIRYYPYLLPWILHKFINI